MAFIFVFSRRKSNWTMKQFSWEFFCRSVLLVTNTSQRQIFFADDIRRSFRHVFADWDEAVSRFCGCTSRKVCRIDGCLGWLFIEWHEGSSSQQNFSLFSKWSFKSDVILLRSLGQHSPRDDGFSWEERLYAAWRQSIIGACIVAVRSHVLCNVLPCKLK